MNTCSQGPSSFGWCHFVNEGDRAVAAPSEWHPPASQPRCCAGSSPPVRSRSCLSCSWKAGPGTFCWRTFRSGCRRSSRPSASPRWPSRRAAGWHRRSTRSCSPRCTTVSPRARCPPPSPPRRTPPPSCLRSKAWKCYSIAPSEHPPGWATDQDFTGQIITEREQLQVENHHSLVCCVNLLKAMFTPKMTPGPLHMTMLLMTLFLSTCTMRF